MSDWLTENWSAILDGALPGFSVNWRFISDRFCVRGDFFKAYAGMLD